MEFLKKTFFIVERVTRSKRFWFLIFILFVMLSSAGEPTSPYPLEKKTDTYEYKLISGSATSNNRILVIPVHGIIFDKRIAGGNPFSYLDQGATYGSEVKDMLVRASKDKSIKGILLDISSPGGTIPGSKAISDGVAYYRAQTKNPVYSHISGEGLSGGYWSAASTQYIAADQGSLIGSIGVILGPFKNYKDVVSEGDFAGSVVTDGGIDTYFFTGGKYKDTGSPYRAMTDEETKHWQDTINREYAMFVKHISDNRNVSESFVRDTIKALPYETQKSLEYKLIDAIGSQEYTTAQLLKAAGIKGKDYQVIQQKGKYGFWSDLLSAASAIKPPQVETSCKLCGRPLFLYDPGYRMITKSSE